MSENEKVEENNSVYLCQAKLRYEFCIINRNFCCPSCDHLDSCLIQYKNSKMKGVKPCEIGMEKDILENNEVRWCEYIDEI